MSKSGAIKPGAIPFIKDFNPRYGEVDKISPHLSRIVAQNPGPFTFTGTGVYILSSGAKAAVIDPGPILEPHIEALTQALSGKTLTHILLTHHHADHSPAAAVLSERFDCPVYGLRPTRAMGETSLQMDEGDDPNFAPDITVCDGDIFVCGDQSLQAIYTPGHTSNHICYYWREAGALFSGDHIMGWATSVVLPPDGDMALYLESLKRVQRLAPKTIYPTHGAPISEPAPFLDAYIAHRYSREAQILVQLSDTPRSIMDIVKALYTDIDPRLFPAAAMSVWSHLIKLHRENRVMSEGNPILSAQYRLP